MHIEIIDKRSDNLEARMMKQLIVKISEVIESKYNLLRNFLVFIGTNMVLAVIANSSMSYLWKRGTRVFLDVVMLLCIGIGLASAWYVLEHIMLKDVLQRLTKAPVYDTLRKGRDGDTQKMRFWIMHCGYTRVHLKKMDQNFAIDFSQNTEDVEFYVKDAKKFVFKDGKILEAELISENRSNARLILRDTGFKLHCPERVKFKVCSAEQAIKNGYLV